MKKTSMSKRLVSAFLAVLMAFTGLLPAVNAFAADGVEGYYELELFYKDRDTIVPSTMLNDQGEEVAYIEKMVEGDELALTYKLVNGTVMPDNGYVKWYSETPTLVDVTQEGVVKAFDSSKGAVIHTWINNEVKTIPLVGSVIATVIEKALFNQYVDVDTMDTDAIVAIVEGAFGSDSVLDKWIESYKGELIDSLRYYLDHVNSNIHVQLFASDGTLLADDYIQIAVTRNNEWYANFLPNGTHITNKSQINTTVAVGSTVQLYAITTPVRLEYGCIYSVKSTSVFDQGKVVATVDDSGLVTFKNKGTVTIMVSPDTEQVIQNILALINKFYEINTEMIDSDKLAEILIKYVGIDMNRNVLAALLDTILAIYDIAGGVTDPVKLAATAAKIIGNLVMQFAYNDTITFTVVDAQPLTDFKIDGATNVKEGSEIQLSIVDIQPSTGDTSDITWRSSDPSIAYVDEKTGTIIGRDAGDNLGALSSQTCTIYAKSAANNIERPFTITVVRKSGQYISDIDILGEQYLEMGMESDYSYSVYPKRVAEGNALSIQWGMVTGEDEDGNPVYTWADSENPATDGRGSMDSKGHYKVLSGGISFIAVKARTGYNLPNGNFYEISTLIETLEITNGIPVDSIQINASDATGIAGSLNKIEPVNIDGMETTYVSVKAGTQYTGVGAVINANIYPANATNQNLTWVVDNGHFKSEPSSDTHQTTVKRKAVHEGAPEEADTFNIYAVSADGMVKSNTVTVCVSKNNVTSNVIDQESIEIVRGKTADATHSIDFDKSTDGTYSACYKCNWYSTDESIFTVTPKNNSNRDATIHAADVGTATLICVSADGGVQDTCQVTVYPDKDYLRNIIKLCEKTVIKRTAENASLYKAYMNSLDLAYTILNNKPMASQTVCDTYADELLTNFYKLGGFVGLVDVNILDKGGRELKSNYITVNVGSTSNYKNYSYDFDFKVAPKNAMYSTVTWESSNPLITVDKNGVCRPKENKACAAVITCTVADYMGETIQDSVCIAFSRTPATGVTLNTNTIDGGLIGETQTLEATVSPTGAVGSGIGGASNADVIWSSSDETIATVDQNGVVKFVEGGSCIITATTIDGGHTADCAVSVVTNYTALELLVKQYNDLSLNSINYYPESWEVYTAAMAKAQEMLERANSSQKEVDKMYAELETAYKSLEKYNYIQNVELYLDGEQTQEFYQYDLSVLSEGISYKNAVLDLNVRLYPNNGSYSHTRWYSSTTDISVTQDGRCSPTDNKSCYGLITCEVYDHFGNVFTDSVWVSFSYIPVTALEISEYNISGPKGTTHQLLCTVKPEPSFTIGQKPVLGASIKDYFWECDDESIATVDQTGLVTFVSAGSTIVRAVSYDGGISAECRVSGEGDRNELKKAIEQCKDTDYTNYEYNYSMSYVAAMEEAERALTDISYTQEKIDNATANLIDAYNDMISHPYIKSEGVTVSYTTTKDPAIGSKKDVASGTIGSSDALSVDLSKDYATNNYNNWATLTAAPSPDNAMYKSISWKTESSKNVEVSPSNNSVKIKPNQDKNDGGWAILTVTITDDYGRNTVRTVYVSLSDKVCTGFDITDGNKTVMATDTPQQINYTISGSPEFTDIIWTSSNTDAVTVDANGVITPVEKGSAVITGKTVDGGYSDTVKITVQADFSALAAKQTEYYELVESVKNSYTYTKDSLDILAAIVNEAQTMINDGKATQAEINEMITRLDEAYDSLVVYVPVRSVSISAKENSNVTVVKDGYIHYIGLSINGRQLYLQPVFNSPDAVCTEITWTSSNPEITVDEEGILTNTSANSGVTLVTCTCKNVFGNTCSATAYVSFARYAVTGISFAEERVFGAPSQTVQLAPVISNTNNSNLKTTYVSDCIYTSDNPDVATVDENGVVTFITQGEVNITATTLDGGYSATIKAYTTWDTTALKAAIDQAQDITYTDYAYSYGTAFKQALDNAAAVYDNVYASQAEIDTVCAALTETMNALEGNAFIVPEISLVQGETVLADGDLVQVDTASQKATVSLKLNEGAMVKSSTVTTSDENNLTAAVNGTDIAITKTGDVGSMVVNVTVVDDYDREYTATYTLRVIDTMIPVTSIVITADGEAVGEKLTHSCGGTYTRFKGIQLDYIPTPENANAVTSVEYISSSPSTVTVKDGLIELTAAGKLQTSNTATITCRVTNADGTVAETSFVFTITRR